MTAEERAKVFKALADPRRVEIVDLLAQQSSCGTSLAESLGISVALLCHHWDVLVDAGILRKERQGQKRICTLDLARVREATGGWEPGGGAAGSIAGPDLEETLASGAAPPNGASAKPSGAAGKPRGAAAKTKVEAAGANGSAAKAGASGAAAKVKAEVAGASGAAAARPKRAPKPRRRR